MGNQIGTGPGPSLDDPVRYPGRKPKKPPIEITPANFKREINTQLDRIAKYIGSGRSYKAIAPLFDSVYYVHSRYQFKQVRFSNTFSGPLQGLCGQQMIGAEVNYFFQGLLAQQCDRDWGTFKIYHQLWKVANIIVTLGKYSMPTSIEEYMARIGYDYGRHYQGLEDRAWVWHLARFERLAGQKGLSAEQPRTVSGP